MLVSLVEKGLEPLGAIGKAGCQATAESQGMLSAAGRHNVMLGCCMCPACLQVHERAFQANPGAGRDVRKHLSSVRSSILEGVRVLFSHVIPQNYPQPRSHPMWQLAEQVCVKAVSGLLHQMLLFWGSMLSFKLLPLKAA